MEITHREFLPSPTKSVHASSVEIWDGHPVFAWFGGSREGDPDVCIYLYNLNNKKELILVGHDHLIPRWNPILFNINDSLFLFEKAGAFCDRWQTFIHKIEKWDQKTTKKEKNETAMILPAGLNGPVKSRPLFFDETLYCGSSVETFFDWTSYIEEYYIKNNKFEFKQRSRPLTESTKYMYSHPNSGATRITKGIIQPTLWDDNENIYALFRSSHGLNRVFFSHKPKKGGKWSKPVRTNLPNPNSAVDVAKCNNKLYLAWNPEDKKRTPLIISLINLPYEKDANEIEIEIEESITVSDNLNENNFIERGVWSPELSYPYMIENDGKLHLTYTYGRKKIEYCVIAPN